MPLADKYLPAMHLMQAEAPADAMYVPALQLMQTVEESAAECLPA